MFNELTTKEITTIAGAFESKSHSNDHKSIVEIVDLYMPNTSFDVSFKKEECLKLMQETKRPCVVIDLGEQQLIRV